MSKKNNKLYNSIEYYAFRGLIGFLRLLPYAFSKWLICSLFLLVGYRIGIRRKIADIQLRKVFPELSSTERQTILKKMYRGMALTTAEEYVIPEQRLISTTGMLGREYVDQALGMGRGAILATAHFGNWESARIMPLMGIPLSVVTKRQRNIRFDTFTNNIREMHGVSVIDMRRGLRDILHHLKNNELVAILADQNAGQHGIIFDFMGYPASHWLGVAKISLRYKVPIVPGFSLRKPDGTLVFSFEPIIYHPELEDVPENYETILRELDKILIRYIKAYPEQWFWVHKRWKGAYNMFA